MVHRGQVIGLININHSSLSSGCANLGLSKLLVLVLTALTALGIDGGLSIAVPLPPPLPLPLPPFPVLPLPLPVLPVPGV